jgi:hypothetical protein
MEVEEDQILRTKGSVGGEELETVSNGLTRDARIATDCKDIAEATGSMAVH